MQSAARIDEPAPGVRQRLQDTVLQPERRDERDGVGRAVEQGLGPGLAQEALMPLRMDQPAGSSGPRGSAAIVSLRSNGLGPSTRSIRNLLTTFW